MCVSLCGFLHMGSNNHKDQKRTLDFQPGAGNAVGCELRDAGAGNQI